MPLPTEPRTIFLGGLFLLAALAALYVASPIVLPVVLAIVLKLLLQPLVRLTDRLGLPRGIGAVLAILLLVAGPRRPDQRRRRPGRLLGRQAAGRDPADPAAACLPGPPDRLAGMDAGATAKRHRRRRRRAAGAARALVQHHGRAVQRHRDRRRRPVHHAGRAVLPAGLGRNVPAPLRRDPADLRREAPGGGDHAGHRAATSPPI